MSLVSRHEHTGGGMAGENVRLQSALEGEGKPLRAELAPFAQVVKANLPENPGDDSEDGLRWCPWVVGYQRRELMKRLFRMDRENLDLTFSRVIFTGAHWTVKVIEG